MIADPRLYQDLIGAVDTRVRQHLAQQPRSAYGTVASTDASAATCSVYIEGDAVPSVGFRLPTSLGRYPVVGERVQVVIDPRGDRYVNAFYSDIAGRIPTRIDPVAASADGSSTNYPLGISTMIVGIADGYPYDFMHVQTNNVSGSARVVQIASTHQRGGHSLARSYHSSIGWTEWKPITQSLNGYTTANFIDAITGGSTFTADTFGTTNELGAIPGSYATHAFGWIIASHNTTATNSNSVRAHDYAATDANGPFGGTVYVNHPTSGLYTSSFFIVELGGTNNRQFKYSIQRSAGTITVYIRVGGWWTL